MRVQMTALMLFAAVLLVGCKNKAIEAFSTSTEADALMQIAFPGWEKDAAVVTQITWPEADASGVKHDESMWIQVTPVLVASLSADRALLIVAGMPSDEKGNNQAGHASPGNLGAYWFARREGKWYAAGEQPSFTWTGFFGEPGEVKLTQLGAGQQAIAVENGSCWQGQCGKWLSLYALGTQSVSPLLEKDESIMLESEDTGSTASCGSLVEEKAGTQLRTSLDDYSTAYGCFAVSGTWQIVPGKAQPGDLVINFSGKQTAAQTVAIATPANPGSAASQPETEDAPGDAPTEEYLVSVSEIKEKLIYRFKDGRYHHFSGKNPAPGI